MKLSPLLTQYLLIKRQLILAGIGRFKLDDSIVNTEEIPKSGKSISIGKIVFEFDKNVKDDPELIAFIAEHTGKMKSLAASDLDSHLELARQFLNIGKPFYLEGIGTLSKNKSGVFEFNQSTSSVEKVKESANENSDPTSTTEESFTNYEEMFSPKKPKTPASKRIIPWIIAIAGISLAVFGGYLVYNRTKPKKKPVTEQKEAVTTIKSEPDTANAKSPVIEQKKDSLISAPKKQANSSGQYRFVIETAQRPRALYRYNFLRENFIDVKMETRDSLTFKLYFLLQSSPADTTKKRDSLQRLYGTRDKVYVDLK